MAPNPMVLITAGSVGLGATVSRFFAIHGFKVVVNCCANSTRAEELITELNAAKDHAENGKQHIGGHMAILSSCSDVARLVQQTYQVMARIDVIFSNGGWTQFRDTTHLEDNVVDEDLDQAYTKC